MKTAILALILAATTACLAPVETRPVDTSTTEQGLCIPCDWDEYGGPIYCGDCGTTGGGGGDPTGGGGGGSGCPIRNQYGECVQTPSGNRCPSVVACDPTTPTESYYCMSFCSNSAAKCYSAYRCPTDGGCDPHIGYCGLF